MKGNLCLSSGNNKHLSPFYASASVIAATIEQENKQG